MEGSSPPPSKSHHHHHRRPYTTYRLMVRGTERKPCLKNEWLVAGAILGPRSCRGPLAQAIRTPLENVFGGGGGVSSVAAFRFFLSFLWRNNTESAQRTMDVLSAAQVQPPKRDPAAEDSQDSQQQLGTHERILSDFARACRVLMHQQMITNGKSCTVSVRDDARFPQTIR